jgi:hypothetical protein
MTALPKLPKEVSADVFAALVGCTKRSVNQLAEKKVLHRLQGGRFNLEDNIPLYIAHREQAATRAAGATGPYAEARADLTRERAAILKIQRQKMEGEVVPIRAQQLANTAIVVVIRARFLGQGNVIAAKLANKSAPECCLILDKHNREILEELSQLDVWKEFFETLHTHGIVEERDGQLHITDCLESLDEVIP